MLQNARTFIDATPYKALAFDEDSMRAEFLLMMESGLCFIAEENGIHAGGIGAVKQPLFFNKDISIAGERFWWVEPSARAGGAGKELLAALFTAAKEMHCDYMMMLSLDPQIDKLYIKLGFEEVEHGFFKRL